MRRWAVHLALALLPLPLSLPAVMISGQNEARYRRGEASLSGYSSTSSSFENALEINAAYENFRVYLRQRYLLQSEFGVRQTGLEAVDKKYIEYKADPILVRGGDFYRTWGRGLLFGNTELTDINYDSGIEGLLVEGSFDRWDAALFRGIDIDTTGTTLEEGEGAWLSYRSPFGIRLGASAVYLEETQFHPHIDRRGFESEADLGLANIYFAYTWDRYGDPQLFALEQPINPHGFYGALSTNIGRLGVLVDYKNYRMITDRSGDQPLTYLQYAPTVLPEVTLYLLDREIRKNRFDDAVGLQIDLTYSPGEWEYEVNLAHGSEHKTVGMVEPQYPSDRSRYKSALIGIERHPVVGDRFLVQAGYKESADVSPPPPIPPPQLRSFTYWVYSRAVRGLYEREIFDRITISVDAQTMWRGDQQIWFGDEVYAKRFRDDFLAITVSRSPDVTLTGVVERSGDRDEVGGELGKLRRYWTSGEITVNALKRHQVRFFYGHERGGLRCSGGICRWVNPFKGVKVTLTSMF